MTLVLTIVAAVFLPVASCLMTIANAGPERKVPARAFSKVMH